jgi:formylglycine-generating enzyme
VSPPARAEPLGPGTAARASPTNLIRPGCWYVTLPKMGRMRRLLALTGSTLLVLAACGNVSTVEPPAGAAGNPASGSSTSNAGATPGATGGAASGARGGTFAAGNSPSESGAAGTAGGAAGASGSEHGLAGAGEAGAAGAATEPARCAGVPAVCGPAGDADCCAASLIPGGTFNRSNDPAYPATVSSFKLDIYEVTVGRFRGFVDAYPASKPAAGSGRNPNDAHDEGWDPAWPLPADRVALLRMLKCDQPKKYAWTDSAAEGEGLPINCLDFYVSFAFCIWDGGRLPTEAEWNYAAAGGAQQRSLPWSSPAGEGECAQSGLPQAIQRVGFRSPGCDGRWGQADLSGNVYERTRDWMGAYPVPCVDCAGHTEPEGILFNVDRGGGFYHWGMSTATRDQLGASTPEADTGVRCARAP